MQKPIMHTGMDHTNNTIFAFTPQSQSITALWLNVPIHGGMARLSWPGWLVRLRITGVLQRQSDILKVAFKRGHVENSERSLVDNAEVDLWTLQQNVDNVMMFLIYSIMQHSVAIFILIDTASLSQYTRTFVTSRLINL